MIDIIRRSGLMEHFPDSTPTDLYLYAMDYLHKLREAYGTTLGDAEDAVEDLVEMSEPEGWLARRQADAERSGIQARGHATGVRFLWAGR